MASTSVLIVILPFSPNRYFAVQPSVCRNPQCGNRSKFMLDTNKSRFIDFQKLRIQETQSELPRGSIPRTYVWCRCSKRCLHFFCQIFFPLIAMPSIQGGSGGASRSGRGRAGRRPMRFHRNVDRRARRRTAVESGHSSGTSEEEGPGRTSPCLRLLEISLLIRLKICARRKKSHQQLVLNVKAWGGILRMRGKGLTNPAGLNKAALLFVLSNLINDLYARCLLPRFTCLESKCHV